MGFSDQGNHTVCAHDPTQFFNLACAKVLSV